MSSGRKRGFEDSKDIGEVKKSKGNFSEPTDQKFVIPSPFHESPYNRFTNKPFSTRFRDILEKRKILPVWKERESFIRLYLSNQVMLLVGDTGSGKTTQCPQFVYECGIDPGKRIAVTQPRRVATMSVSRRVAEEMDVELGTYVGYSMRFEEKCLKETVIKFVTDGMLLRESMRDKMLTQYQVIMLDEAHERTLPTDVLFGFIKELLPKRPDLKVIIMSATLESEKFKKYFKAPQLTIPGKTFPVEIFYSSQAKDDYLEAAISTVVGIHKTETKGDILLFLTGEEEIEKAAKRIERDVSSDPDCADEGILVLPLYASLPPALQQKIFEPALVRKCVVATNIAETSITIDGVVYVVDPGFSKQKVYNPRTRVESLLVSPISKASANQRAGRAGRTAPGKCFRLYTEAAYQNNLLDATHPEILRSSLGPVVLTLKKLHIDDLVHFDFMDPPAPETLMRALEELHFLGALGDEGDLTELGLKMTDFPLDPQLSKMLVESHKYAASDCILELAALLSVGNVFLRPPNQTHQADEAKAKFINSEADHLTLLNVFHQFKTIQQEGLKRKWCSDNFISSRAMSQASNIVEQLQKNVTRAALPMESTPPTNSYYVQNIKRAIVAGFFMQVAFLSKGLQYKTVRDETVVMVHPSSVIDLQSEFVVYQEFVLTTKNYIRGCAKINGKWLLEIAPAFYNLRDLKGDTLAKFREVEKRARHEKRE
eukprot:GHVP01068511.1.p1 GENE.GHVP01068511.1~~GHVP01068511.1.p1  ORF type:complete len:713 (+),score=124.38 GHVP01068511.1:23-2161(+)